MTESRPPSSNRMIRPSIVATSHAAALGHNYSAPQYPLLPPRPKLNQTSQPPGTAASVTPLMTNTETTQFRVSVPLGVSPKEPLTVTSFVSKNPGGIPYPNEKWTLPLTTTSTETHVKANVKNIGIQKVNYLKQPAVAKPHGLLPVTANIIQAPLKKDPEIIKPVLVGPGLRQPLKPHHQHQTTKTNVYRSAPVLPSSWAVSQSDNTGKTAASNIPATITRTKPLFQNSAQHDAAKKQIALQPPKSTISINPTPLSVHRNTPLPVAPLTTGSKPIYQVLATELPATVPVANNTIKKFPAMIVSQTMVNCTSTTAGGQITVMTCGGGSTLVPAPTSSNGTNSTSIPIAKVYPQQQSAARVSVTSTTSSRISVPVLSSSNASSSISRTTPAVIQVCSIRSAPTTSIIMASQTTIMSTIPVAMNKAVSNSSGIGPVICLPASFSPTLPVSTVTSSVNLRSVPSSQQTIPIQGAFRVQPNSVVLFEPKTTHLQDNRTAASSHNTPNSQSGTGPTTPTMSPKPTILRRQRPENSPALKKLQFATSSNFATQRRDIHTKPINRRPAPYTLTRPKHPSSTQDSKTDIPVVLPTGNHGDKHEMKPVLENQVYVKQQLNATGGLTQLKLENNLKPHNILPYSNSAKDGGNHSYSIHPVIETKVKGEPGFSTHQNSVKSEPASASQMLQLQNQSMHTYAAESPHTVSGVPHHIISQASGQHITTNTIFTKPGAHPIIHHGHQISRHKPPPVIKTALPTSVVSLVSQTDLKRPSSQGTNSFVPHRASNFIPDRPGFDFIKKEPVMKQVVNHGQIKSVDSGINLLPNHTFPNHLLHLASPAKSWSNDSLAGLSPRKRPRKQTHIVSEDQPVVMEDEESTDDADEWEDEPMAVTSQTSSISTTPITKLPGHKPSTTQRSKNESSKKINKEEVNHHKYSNVKSESAQSLSTDVKPPSEFTDRNGVRYVVSRKRPSVAVLNRLKPNPRTVANHFLHYSDIKVKDKKTTLSDLASDRNRLKGVKVARFASQINDIVECEKDTWSRMQKVFDGLVEYKSSLAGDVTFDSAIVSPSPGTPSSLSSSFRKATPRSSRSASTSAINENGQVQSPSTPLDRKTNKVKDEIAYIEELAQANLQRCRVVCDQLSDTKTTLLKSVDHRQFVTDILESSSNQKSQVPANNQPTKRLPKKKTSS